MNTTGLQILLIMLTIIMTCAHEINRRNTEDSANIIIEESEKTSKDIADTIINPDGKILETRILLPAGFQRIMVEENSFGEYLRHLPLKPHNSEVKLYDGRTKPNYNIYIAVIDLPIGNKDLHQCADAIMRLRAEYLWSQKQYDKIHFNFTNGFRADYSEWMKGKRIVVKGNTASWVQTGKPSNTYDDLWKYLETVFSWAGTLSLSKELIKVSVEDMRIGDIFIQGGTPGHAVIVVDIAVNPATNEKIFLLAQSYMPAQEIHILTNPDNEKISPWYSAKFGDVLNTPQWVFTKSDLKRFAD